VIMPATDVDPYYMKNMNTNQAVGTYLVSAPGTFVGESAEWIIEHKQFALTDYSVGYAQGSGYDINENTHNFNTDFFHVIDLEDSSGYLMSYGYPYSGNGTEFVFVNGN